MNLLLTYVVLILFVGSSISAADTDELDGINVLKKLKASASACDLHDFVKSDNDYKSLTDDLRKYCSTSESTKQYRLLCHMLAYELKKACKLTGKARPSSFKYVIKTSSEEICQLKNIQLTNQWILKRITNNGEKKLDVTSTDLCTKVTSDTNTIQLARFFYKTAPRVRLADQSSTDGTTSNTNQQTIGETVGGALKTVKDTIGDVAQAAKNKIKEGVETVKDEGSKAADSLKTKADNTLKTAKDTLSDAAGTTKDKAGDAVDSLKDKTGKTVDNTKEKLTDVAGAVKDKADTAAGAVKDKANAAVDSLKDKTRKTAETVRSKTDDDDGDDADDDATKDKAGKTSGREKSKTTGDADNRKEKAADEDVETDDTVDGTKDKTTGDRNSLSSLKNQTGNFLKNALNKTKEAIGSIPKKTGELLKNTGDKAQQILDVGTSKKTDAEDKKTQETKNTEGDDDDDDNNDKDDKDTDNKKSKDNEQGKKSSKSQLSPAEEDDQDGSPAAESKAANKTTTVGVSTNKTITNQTTAAAENLNSSKTNESGNELLSLTELIKKYQISPSQIIEYIKTSRLNPFGDRANASLITSNTTTGVIQNKNITNTSSTLNISTTASSSSAATNTTLGANKPDKEKEKEKNANTNNINPGKSNDPQYDQDDDGDKPSNKEADEQLRKQQEEADKQAKQSALGDKDNAGDTEVISHDDYDAGNVPRKQNQAEDPPDDNEDAEYSGGNKVPDGMKVSKTKDADKSPVKSNKQPSFESSKSKSKPVSSRKNTDDDGWSGNFITYFLVFTLFVVVGYLILHNKNKILGLLIEGCRRNRSSHGRRTGGSSSSTRYQRLSQSS